MAIPLYIQVREALIERIQSGEWPPGTQIPPERELCRQFGTSRMTVRQALGDLVTNGLLIRQQGNGTFVAQPKVTQPTYPLQSFTVTMQTYGIVPGARLIDLQIIPASREISSLLKLHLGERIYRIVRQRTGNQQPLALEYSHFPVRLCPNLERFDLEKRSIYQILKEEYGLELVRAEQTLEPTVARRTEAEWLDLPEGAPLMLWERISYTAEDLPVEYAKDLYRGDRTKFRVNIDLPR
ncbi:MAG: GntR family transcriptional regulator [candidate division KSB1 bacterium]|nr:GntR family transcriptional regulator [candidate division KSB1 bacterium]